VSTRCHNCCGRYATAAMCWFLRWPRGGVPVGFEWLSRAERSSTCSWAQTRLGPGYKSSGWCCIATGGVLILNLDVLTRLCITCLRGPSDHRQHAFKRLDRASDAFAVTRPPPRRLGRPLSLVRQMAWPPGRLAGLPWRPTPGMGRTNCRGVRLRPHAGGVATSSDPRSTRSSRVTRNLSSALPLVAPCTGGV